MFLSLDWMDYSPGVWEPLQLVKVLGSFQVFLESLLAQARLWADPDCQPMKYGFC